MVDSELNDRLAVATGKTNDQLAITAEREAEVARLKHALDNAARKHEETVNTMKAKQQGQINDLNAQDGFDSAILLAYIGVTTLDYRFRDSRDCNA